MKALVLHEIGRLILEEVDTPRPHANEVLIRVGACGVCGSDIPRIFSKGAYRFPIICGHEFAGTVCECGQDVRDVSAGTRVCVFPLIWCGTCRACEQGRYAQCQQYDYLGSRSNGAFAEYVVAPRRNVVPLPDSVSLDEAAMTEPAAVALHAINRAGGVSAGETTAIFGAGPIGIMTAQWAALCGAERVLLFDILPEKLNLARQIGFNNCYNSRETQPEEVVNDLTGGRGAEVVIEAAGAPASLLSCLSVAGLGGRVVQLGNPAADITLPAPLVSRFMRQEITLSGTWNSAFSACGNQDDWKTVVNTVASGRLQLSPLISHRPTLEESCTLLGDMYAGKGVFTKVIVQPDANS